MGVGEIAGSRDGVWEKIGVGVGVTIGVGVGGGITSAVHGEGIYEL